MNEADTDGRENLAPNQLQERLIEARQVNTTQKPQGTSQPFQAQHQNRSQPSPTRPRQVLGPLQSMNIEDNGHGTQRRPTPSAHHGIETDQSNEEQPQPQAPKRRHKIRCSFGPNKKRKEIGPSAPAPATDGQLSQQRPQGRTIEIGTDIHTHSQGHGSSGRVAEIPHYRSHAQHNRDKTA